MKQKYKYHIILIVFSSILVQSCYHTRKLINDELFLKDGNTQTGTILKCDSNSLKLKKMDESVMNYTWAQIDSISGKRYKTFWLGLNTGYYKVPYFSVFRNEPFAAENMGFQLKMGMAYRGNTMHYLNFSSINGRPYSVTKFGYGYLRYVLQKTYLTKNSFFVGSEFNLMNAKYNTGAQFTIEPFTGYERRLNSYLRLHVKLGLQFNVANKNQQTGVNLTVGLHFIKRNFSKYYSILNTQHRTSLY